MEILNYHEDNGGFAGNKFVTDIKAGKHSQGLTFCAIKHHSQNSYAEKCIHDLQELDHTNLLLAQRQWPKAILVNLLPYAVCTTSMVDNTMPRHKDAQTPIELFSGMGIMPNYVTSITSAAQSSTN